MAVTFEELNNESWLKIPDYDTQRPFFMSIVSDSNHWMFISSNGGLTAGRKNADFALFPYYTDDKLTELAHTTGSCTVFQVLLNGETRLWEPFSDRMAGTYTISRTLYKNRLGNKVMFEEMNHDLGLRFRYEWNSSNRYGFVKKSSLINESGSNVRISVLDGIQNIMPHGVSGELQMRVSNLVDAYKRSELHAESGLGMFALSAIIVDKAEPSEALKANVAWSLGLENPNYLLSSLQLDDFRNGKSIDQEEDVKGDKGSYFVHTELDLSPDGEENWLIVANVNQNQSGVIELIDQIEQDEDLSQKVLSDIESGSQKLIQLIAASDGLQKTADPLADTRHYSNTLFNIMRGGIFDRGYIIEKEDFSNYLRNANKEVYNRSANFLNTLEKEFSKSHLEDELAKSGDADLIRLAKEYLPLKFSRRHGDPSRPWNRFSINTHSEIDGSKILDYEGNWRDIFQNWEALVYSYPEFIEGMIFKFLNASTFDGYNPYRVTKDGFDWETIEPDDPWSYIGYWGDHQIIYLLKFLEFYHNYEPEAFRQLFAKKLFVYANVPYRIKSYEDILKDPKDTIDFDHESNHQIRQKVWESGADGALLRGQSGEIHHVNFIEKILATVLSKVSNFIPEGGIWMNTQRPEWNDANNALVGNGVSMVTLCYLRRFLKFFEGVTAESGIEEIEISDEVGGFYENLLKVLKDNETALSSGFDDRIRKEITDGLGTAGSNFRNQVYDYQFSGRTRTVKLQSIMEFTRLALNFMEHSIRANKRDDDLYHAYNLMSVKGEGISIDHLDEMLEGQVAVLSSAYLSPEESVRVLDALRRSRLYREDQNSYILYPNKDLPGFLEKNNIPEQAVSNSKLLSKLVSDGNLRILNRDIKGGYHFNGNFKNANDLKQALNELRGTQYADLVDEEEEQILSVFEQVFNHKAFTGRSGTFFGYEGLGSIYWHMVSKLHLAVTEVCISATQNNTDSGILKKLFEHFDEIGEGIGVHKSPELYGAFPTDPYSHTPNHRGAQQPGMTGQVKEDILVRIAELGVFIENGQLTFNPILLKKSEFLSEDSVFETVTADNENLALHLQSDMLGFSCCQIPVTYNIGDSTEVEIELMDGSRERFEGCKINEKLSRHIFQRTGTIRRITVSIPEQQLR